MEQGILTERQLAVIRLVAKEPLLADFYLTGGTALSAYHLQHRASDDLDFFAFGAPDDAFLRGFAQTIGNALKTGDVRFERLYERRQFFFLFGDEELKIEFSKYPFRQLDPPQKQDGILIDSFRDIAANKLSAVLDRFEPKDFVDLFFVLAKTPLSKVRKDAEQKFGAKIGPIFLGGELMKARRIEALPKMLKPLTIAELKNFFAKTAKSLAPEVIT